MRWAAEVPSMPVESDVAIARAINATTHKHIYATGDRVVLMLFGSFSHVETSDLLCVETSLFAKRQKAEGYECFPATIRAIERFGDGLLCVIESISREFVWQLLTEFFISLGSAEGDSSPFLLHVNVYRHHQGEISA